MIRLEILTELKFLNSGFSSFSLILLKVDKHFSIEQFEPTVSQSAVPSPPLERVVAVARLRAGSRLTKAVWHGAFWLRIDLAEKPKRPKLGHAEIMILLLLLLLLIIIIIIIIILIIIMILIIKTNHNNDT